MEDNKVINQIEEMGMNNVSSNELETNTIVNNQDLVLEKLDKTNTFLSGVFFLMCLWFIIDFMRKMIIVK